MANDKTVASNGKPKKQPPLWIVWVSLLLAGVLLLGEAVGIEFLRRIPMRLGIALVYSALALLVGNGRPVGYIGAGIVWAAVIIAFFV